MKTFDVVFRPLAEGDLFGLYDYIAENAGHEVVGAYVSRMEAACKSLAQFPERGMQRDDIRPGLRTIGFERRATIAFQVKDAEVVILRIFCGGRDYEQTLRGTRDEWAMTTEDGSNRTAGHPAVTASPTSPSSPSGRWRR